MPMNRIQFQPGLSLPAFLEQFGTEAQCEAALERARWPDGFCCPRCGEASHYVLRQRGRKTLQCQNCRVQTSLIAGTLFQSTHLALTLWFLAIYLISQAKIGLIGPGPEAPARRELPHRLADSAQADADHDRARCPVHPVR